MNHTRRRNASRAIPLVVIVMMMLVIMIPAVAQSQGNPSSVECADDQWNGDYWKVQINDGRPGQIEANIPSGNVGYSTAGGVFVWVNLHDAPAFRWLFKSGNETTVPWDGWWEPGEGDSATMPGNLSHVTICFTDPGGSTTTTTGAPTTTTTEIPTTTTTITVTTTVPPSSTTLPTSTTTTMPGTTTTVGPTSTTTTTGSPTTTVTPTTDPGSSTTETPKGGVATGAGGTAGGFPIWVLGAAGAISLLLAGLYALRREN